NGHVKRSSSEREPSPALQLPAGQRLVCHLQRWNAVRQHRAFKSATSAGNTLRDQMDVLLAAIRKTRIDGKSAKALSKNDFRRGSVACDWLRADHRAAHKTRCGEF